MSITFDNISVSFQNNTWSTISTEITVREVFNIIGSEKLKTKIEDLRDNLLKGNKSYYDDNKRRLPAVTFSGIFDIKRRKENLKVYTSLLVIDIDKLSDIELQRVYKILLLDRYVCSFWRSPSNRGFKGLIYIKYDKDIESKDIDFQHKAAFQIVSNYFFKRYQIELDSSGSDITRLCFLSFDKKIVVKTEYEEFQINTTVVPVSSQSRPVSKAVLKFSSEKDALYNSTDRNNPYDRKLMSSIIRYLNNKNKSITDSYECWCRVGLAIANTFTFDVGKNYFLKLSKRDLEKFDEINCLNFLSNCYENRKGEINFASIVYLANQKGYKTKYQKNGVPKAEE